MTKQQLARNLHELWERAQTIRLEAAELLERRLPRQEAFARLALEIALHDLVSFAARAAALADLAEATPPQRRKP